MAKPKGATAVRELEAKFRVHSPFELPVIEGRAPAVSTVDPPARVTMTAVYYDTCDLRLAREGVTLRRRSGGSDAGWHLKLPVAGDSVADGTGVRDELQLPDAPEIPAELADLVRIWVRTASLDPVATLVTERTTFVLRDADGGSLAELVDDTVTVEDSSHIQARFREIEVEDTGGGPDVIAQVATLLLDAGAVGGEFVPKVVRALGPRATAPPEPPAPAPVAPRDPAHDVIAAALRRYTRALMAEDLRVRRNQPDAVHQMRVATRRLRSTFETFSPLLDATWAKSLHAELGWLAGVLGVARDAEVLNERVMAAASELPVVAKPALLRAKLGDLGNRAVEAATSDVLELMAGERYLLLIDRLVDAAMYPRTNDAARRPAGAVLLPLVRTSWARLARRAARVRSGRPDRARYLSDHHRVRIAAKQLRYTCDAVAQALGDDALRLSTQAERVQDLLGEHQDAVVAAAYFADLAARPRVGALGFGLGMMFARQESLAMLARYEFAEVWPEVSRAKYRRWLAE
jgi:CHAD domain-containing protein